MATKRQRKIAVPQSPLYNLSRLKPLTENQKLLFEHYDAGANFIMVHGVAGTGKTFCSMYKAFEEVFTAKSMIDKLYIIRSTVQCRDIGHLPGNLEEKIDIYKQPYQQICSELIPSKLPETAVKINTPWEELQKLNMVEMLTTSFLRGITLNNCVIIVDECQNMNEAELDTIMTRIGTNSRIVFCGDFRQTDLNKSRYDVSGLQRFMSICKLMPESVMLEFNTDDIVRNALVKSYIIAKTNLEDLQDEQHGYSPSSNSSKNNY